ncbi:MAG TPA: HAMP domain-containing sensor histidine kinase [Acidimicrobiales bacterium]|nr:HAMP domain-containing sensor histidine kinase [Acidimicrobiales bacterium]
MTTFGPEELDLVRRRVVNVVGHELRTPLTTIRGLAELLGDASDEELRETLIPALVRNARRAERLLDDLLIAGEIDTARPTVAPTEVDLVAIVRDAVAESDVGVEDTEVPPVVAHHDQIAHAVAHLVENARQYADGPPAIRFEVDDGTVSVLLRTPVDRALPPVELELGFELFFRGEQAVTRAAGLGIGLPVARALARMDGGDVTIADDGGDVVTRLSLPRA